MGMRRGDFLARALSLAAVGFMATAPAFAAGFSIFEQGSKAMGMAGAFTAQADDPSLLFHNAGGLAFVTEREISGGATYIKGDEATFRGAAPFPGAGITGEQELLNEVVPHVYYVQPINDIWKFGFGINAPFGLTTEWKDPDQFAGRFLSTKAALRAIDVNPTIGWQITPSFGIGIGAVARFSDVELNRNVPQINPFTQRVADIGRLKLTSDFDTGYGFNVGVLNRVNNSFSWGLSYRSKVKVKYEGEARLTQVATGSPQFDALLRSRLPYDRDLGVKTEIEFPDIASLGLAFGLSPNLLLETDVNWMGWSSFSEVPIDFTGNELPDSTIPENWDDVFSYRAGLRYTVSPATQLRLGYVFDETPQPEEGVSPLLPDADRNGITIGYGYTGGIKADIALMYLDFKERTRARSFEGEGPFFGTYKTKAWLLGATVSF
jgi:long-chain fatty acid transport protein